VTALLQTIGTRTQTVAGKIYLSNKILFSGQKKSSGMSEGFFLKFFLFNE